MAATCSARTVPPMNSTAPTPRNVVIAGGGVAALEAAMALRDLAGDRVRITLVTPESDFVLRPLRVGEPFSVNHVRRYPLREVARELDAELVIDAVTRVDEADKTITCASDRELPYDDLIVAVGGKPVPAFEHAMTFGTERDPEALNGILADLEGGYSKSVAFVVPPGVTWPLPLYELALMTARQVRSMSMDDVRLVIVTPEGSPLAVFGPQASDGVRELLDAAGIEVVTGVYASVIANGRVGLGRNGDELAVDRIVALPLVEGRRIPGVSSDPDGFIPIDDHAHVVGMQNVYAAGDGANFPIKQGGIATQQADAAASAIAADAGAVAEPEPFRPVLRGRLMTGDHDRFLHRPAAGDGESRASDEPLFWPPTKVSGRYLSPWLARQERPSEVIAPEPKQGTPVEVELPLDAERVEAMTLETLGPSPFRH